ncbi:nitrous oxide reductase family maturation protein NosD [bacterium]|nr:nitrous oxide reductase family maturation protein NosD [bacterium]
MWINIVSAKELIVGESGEFRTIRSAIESARDGDRIIVKSGIYREGALEITRAITLTGENGAVLDGENKFQILTVKASGVTVNNLTFENVGVSYVQDNAAIKLIESDNSNIIDNRFRNAFFGIYLSKSGFCTIRGNDLVAAAEKEASSGNGIHLWNCHDITIENNSIQRHRDGIYFEFVKRSTITGNHSIGNLRYGLHFMFSDTCVYKNNLFKGNSAGVAVMYTKNITMQGNRFEDNWGAASYGILLKDITGSEITGNTFMNNTVGIHAEGTSRNRISDNEFLNNGWAVRIMANSTDNVFSQNNFIGNAFDVATNSRQNYNVFDSNYWSAYEGYDLNRDGVGDVPFRPVRLFSLLIEQYPTALILLRSFLIDVIDAAESVIPALTPETLTDANPRMRRLP